MPDESHSHIGARLREIRKRRGLTQRELAEISGVSLSLIRKLEQGERTDTRIETSRQLAVALHVPTTRLVGEGRQEGADEATTDHWAPVRRALIRPADIGRRSPHRPRGAGGA